MDLQLNNEVGCILKYIIDEVINNVESCDNKKTVKIDPIITVMNEGGYVRKERLVDDDMNSNRFISTEAKITKRKNKSKALEEEEIKLDVYKYKCGFTTQRPLAWAKILET